MEVERKPRVGIIGTGWGVRVQVPAFRKAGWEVTALSGRDEAKVRIRIPPSPICCFLLTGRFDWECV